MCRRCCAASWCLICRWSFTVRVKRCGACPSSLNLLPLASKLVIDSHRMENAPSCLDVSAVAAARQAFEKRI